MKLAFGTIASLFLTVGALLVLVVVNSSDNAMKSGSRPPKTSYLRSGSSRKLYNYSNNNGNNANYNGYNGGYGGNYGGNYGDNSGGNYGGNYGGNSGGNYGGNYGDNSGGNYGNGGNADGGNYGGNYGANSYNNDGGNGGNYANYDSNGSYYGNYGSGNYAAYANNYEADGTTYNGRDQNWGGYSVQAMTDDEEPTVEVEVYGEDDKYAILGKFGGLSATETLAVASLFVLILVSALCCMMLIAGINIIDVCQLYCCGGIFGHKDETAKETVDDGFVKLG